MFTQPRQSEFQLKYQLVLYHTCMEILRAIENQNHVEQTMYLFL